MSRRFPIVLTLAASLIFVSCRRESTTTVQETSGTPTTTTTTLTGDPQDLRNAKINTVISPDSGRFINDSRIGSTVGTDGMVTDGKEEFMAGEEIYLSLWLKESPPSLVASAVLQDADGEEIDVERKPLNGAKNVTFPIGDRKLKAGRYKVLGYWGGNVAAEHDFSVTGPAPPEPSKAKAKAKSKAKTP